jgi:hypothetical protein
LNPNPNAEGLVWTSFVFDQPRDTAFSVANRSNFVDPLIARAAGQTSLGPVLVSQPTYQTIYDEIASFSTDGNRPDNLIQRLLAPTSTSDTRAIAKGVCASVLGSAATLVQ